MKEIVIKGIKQGTVIDHIKSSDTFKILRLLDPQEYKYTMSLALNLHSKKHGKKGVIKISNRELTTDEVNKVAILSPHATVSYIKNYEVAKKIRVKLPKQIEHIVKCSNPNCITNKEEIATKFNIEAEDPLKIRCYFCERSMYRDDIKII